MRSRSKLCVQAPKALARSISSGADRSPPATRAAKRSRRLKGRSTRTPSQPTRARTRTRVRTRVAVPARVRARWWAATAVVYPSSSQTQATVRPSTTTGLVSGRCSPVHCMTPSPLYPTGAAPGPRGTGDPAASTTLSASAMPSSPAASGWGQAAARRWTTSLILAVSAPGAWRVPSRARVHIPVTRTATSRTTGTDRRRTSGPRTGSRAPTPCGCRWGTRVSSQSGPSDGVRAPSGCPG